MYHRRVILLRCIFLLLCVRASTSEAQKKRELVNTLQAPANLPTRHTVSEYQNPVPLPVPQPIPVHIPRPVPVQIPVGVPVDSPRPIPVIVPHPVPHIIHRPFAVPIDRPFPYPVPHPVPISITQGIGIPVPQPYAVSVPSPVPVRVPVFHPLHPNHLRLPQRFIQPVQPVGQFFQPVVAHGNTVVENHGQSIVHPY